MAELTIQHVSKPIIVPSAWYDLSYEHNITPTARATPMPCDTLDDVNLLTAQLVASDGRAYDRNSFYTEWVDGSASFSIDDPSNVHSTWRLKCGALGYMSSTYGLLPATTYTGYEFLSVNELKAYGDWRRFLLYELTNGKYVPVGSVLDLSNGGGNAPIYYDVTLRNPNTGDTVNVAGASTSYTVANSPTGKMCLYQPFSTFASNGDMKGQIIMTETPAN